MLKIKKQLILCLVLFSAVSAFSADVSSEEEAGKEETDAKEIVTLEEKKERRKAAIEEAERLKREGITFSRSRFQWAITFPANI